MVVFFMLILNKWKKETKEKIRNLPFILLKSLQPLNEKGVFSFLKYQKKVGNVLRLERGMYVFEEFIKKKKRLKAKPGNI